MASSTRNIPWPAIGRAIEAVAGLPGTLEPLGSVPGGDINRAERARFGGTDYFIKLNEARRVAMFEAEADGLAELAGSATLRIPAPICHGQADGISFLVLEYLDLGPRGDARSLGAGLAAMHRVRRPEHGWSRDNTIGATLQINASTRNWTEFWRTRRLGFQLELARTNGYGGRLQSRGERLMDALGQLLANYHPPASLLHGDLWAGNHAYAPSGEPVLFDPAVYFGDRETDLAMTELFGGFGADFHAAYRDHYPLDSGFGMRKTLYNLYHVLNHLNLFGGAFLGRAEHMIDTLLAELG